MVAFVCDWTPMKTLCCSLDLSLYMVRRGLQKDNFWKSTAKATCNFTILGTETMIFWTTLDATDSQVLISIESDNHNSQLIETNVERRLQKLLTEKNVLCFFLLHFYALPSCYFYVLTNFDITCFCCLTSTKNIDSIENEFGIEKCRSISIYFYQNSLTCLCTLFRIHLATKQGIPKISSALLAIASIAIAG